MRYFALLFAPGSLALGQDSLSLRDCVRMALERNQLVESAVASRDAAEARIVQARSGMLPKVNYSESWTRSDNPVFVFSSLLTQRQFGPSNLAIEPLNHPGFLNNFQSLLTADQPLYDAGKTKRAVRTAELGRSLTDEEVRRSRLQVIAQTVQSYYGAQLAAKQVDLAVQAARSAQADLERAEARRAGGVATDADVLSIRVHQAAVEEERIRRAADLDIALAAINDGLALPLETRHQLTTPIEPLPGTPAGFAAAEEAGVRERPEARQARIEKEIAQVQAKDARGSLLPQVAARGAFEADRQRFYNRAGANWLVSIGLRWNLFNGLSDKARITETEATVRRGAALQSRTESAIRLEVRRAWARLDAARQRIETSRASVAEAEETLRISRNRYGAGLSTVTDLLRTETALLEAQTRYLGAVHDQRVAAVMLEFAAGTLSQDSEVLN
ncbi:MAG: TolC family protein [Acidobacteria bacterium]|nr:TolC family protein [Acidobacteriota bacterium]